LSDLLFEAFDLFSNLEDLLLVALGAFVLLLLLLLLLALGAFVLLLLLALGAFKLLDLELLLVVPTSIPCELLSSRIQAS